MSVYYEVNVQVDTACLGEWLEFMDVHVPQLLELPGFQSADVSLPEPDPNAPLPVGKTLVTSMYLLQSRELLQRYFDNEAAAMRADTLRRFEGRITATRRILAVHKAFHKKN
jgi:hypothetical protein